MSPTIEQTRAGYHTQWNRAEIVSDKAASAKTLALRIAANRDKYTAVEKATGVPWFIVGVLHNRESSLSFNGHLHCGDPLTARTYHVPAGRPKAPPANGQAYTWPESAVDALVEPPHSLGKVTDWSVEQMLYRMERYNGFGYRNKGRVSPYLWAWTSEYAGGKYIADGVYDPNTWDKQAGCAAIIKALARFDEGAAQRLTNRQKTPPTDVISDETKAERTARNGGVVVAGGGTLAEATKPPLPSFVTYAAIGIGIAIVIVAVILIARKKSIVISNWR